MLSIQPPETITASLEDFENVNAAELISLPLEAARGKWFDKAKGFGFANIWQESEDVFVHVEILRRSGLADLQAGEAVAIRVISGNRGKMVLKYVHGKVYHATRAICSMARVYDNYVHSGPVQSFDYRS